MKEIQSQQVSWWDVQTFVDPWLAVVGSWPTAGTPAWCALPDGDPAKIAALCDAARHWALRLELNQEARADASQGVSGAVDWAKLSREIQQRSDFREARPWAKRMVS